MSLITFVIALMLPLKNVLTYMRSAISSTCLQHDPTITASAIAPPAFQKFLESGVGELGKKFTSEAIAKMDILLKRIRSKLSGKPHIEEVKAPLDEIIKITPKQVNQISAYLQVAMDEDPTFASVAE